MLMLVLACSFAVGQAPVPASSLPLLLPSAIAYDHTGDLYIAESQRHAIRKLDPLGIVSTIAGDGTQGFSGDGGAATLAQLNSPQGVAVDTSENIYLSDSSNNRIRRIDAATGTITTIAGDGATAFAGDGGPALKASLNLPRSICLDPLEKNLYVADTKNHRIRRIDLGSGTITTVAGNGLEGFSGDGQLAVSASLASPESVALDAAGNLYIADTHNQRIRRVAADTKLISTIAGDGHAGLAPEGHPAIAASLSLPRGLTTDAKGNLYVVESSNHRVLRIDSTSGAISVTAGSTVQNFAGDGGQAVLASLNSPRSAALSPGGLVTISDTGNSRVRQLLADPAPATQIQTIAGPGATSSQSPFSISAKSVSAYGAGTLTASFPSSASATGLVTFFEIGKTGSSVLSSLPLTTNAATLSLSMVSAGQHRFMATYSGDATHAPAQTSTALVTISPLVLRVTPTAAAMTYGSPLPALSGTLDGLLPQDATRITAVFTTPATSTSIVGSYPIAVALNGVAAVNYTLQSTPAYLLITQASSSTLLRNSNADGSFDGVLQLQVTSSTSGSPMGFVILFDNGGIIQQATLAPDGTAALSPILLAAGTHSITAAYSGDQNFLPSTSSALTELISSAPAADFTITAAEPTTQTLLPGASIHYLLSVQMTGSSLSSPIALSVTGLPAFTKASFDPGYISPGSGAQRSLILTVSASAVASNHDPGSVAPFLCVLVLPMPLIALISWRAKTKKRGPLPKLIMILGVIAIVPAISACGNRVNTSAQTGPSVQTYAVTVAGTATDSKGGTLQHTTNIVLKMQSSQ